MAFPKTVEQLLEQKYVFVEEGFCRGVECARANKGNALQIEWWRNPRTGKKMPLEVTDQQEITPHWGNCPDQAAFRK